MNRRNAMGNLGDLARFTKRPSSTEAVKGSPSFPTSPPEWNPDASHLKHQSQSQAQSSTAHSPISTSFYSPSSPLPVFPRTHSITNPCAHHHRHHQPQEKPSDTQLTNPSSTSLQSNSSTAPAAPPPINSHAATTTTTSTHNNNNTIPAATAINGNNSNNNNNEAASKLAEALDDFLGDVERKFKGISEEILARLDEMAERCDRLESELSRKENPAKKDGVV